MFGVQRRESSAVFQDVRSRHLPRIVDTLKQVIIDYTRGVDVENEMTLQHLGVSGEGCIRCREDLSDRQRFGLSDFGRPAALFAGLLVELRVRS
jgi:hypothetical protein